MIKILIADDHAMVRAGFHDILAVTTCPEFIKEAGNGQEVLSILKKELPDILLTDLSMPGMDGFDLIARAKALYPTLPILVLTTFCESEMARRAIKAGADGYITKLNSPEELIKAVSKIIAGGKYIDSELAEVMLFNPSDPIARHSKLSNREFEVLRFLVKGERLNDIADHLSISCKTVSSHKSALLNKMEMKNTAELVRYAIEHRIFIE